jgi:hypothetical protein
MGAGEPRAHSRDALSTMPPPRGTTLTGPELQQLRRGALTLEHLAHDMQKGTDPATIARRLLEVRDTITYLIDRAQERGTLH